MRKTLSTDSEVRRKFWEHHLAQWQAGGLPQAEYCRRHGLSVKTFGYHKRTKGTDSLCLVEVPLAVPVCSLPKPLSLTVGSRYTIRIEAGFDAQTLRDLLEVLDR
jgi:hypothetical protein